MAWFKRCISVAVLFVSLIVVEAGPAFASINMVVDVNDNICHIDVQDDGDDGVYVTVVGEC